MISSEILKTVCQVINADTGDVAGGVFISSNGDIVTCYRITAGENVDLVVSLPGEDPQKIHYQARVLFTEPLMDFALLTIGRATTDFVTIPHTLGLNWDDEVIAISHQNNYGTISAGRVVYPFLAETELPELKKMEWGEKESILSKKVPISLEARHCVPDLEIRAYLQPNIPLVMVQSSALGAGSSGCPLFSKDNHEYLGYLIFAGTTLGYYIPCTLIGKVLADRGGDFVEEYF